MTTPTTPPLPLPAGHTLTVVIGAPRSGTTLLGGLLSEDTDAYPMLPECTSITQIIQHYHNFIHYGDAQRLAAYAVSPERLAPPYQHMVADLVGIALSHFEGQPYRHLVLKDPELTLLADEIPRFFGDEAKVVCVMRDPRAVIASMKKVWQKKRAASLQQFRTTPNWATLGQYLQDYTQSRSLAGMVFNYYWRLHQSALFQQGRIHVVRYEAIIAGDESEFQRLEAFLGYPCGRKGFGKVHFEFDRSDKTFSDNYGKAINPEQSNFRDTLGALTVWRLQRLFGGFNQTYRWW